MSEISAPPPCFDRLTFINHSGQALELVSFDLLDDQGVEHHHEVGQTVEPGEDVVVSCRDRPPVRPTSVSCAVRDASGSALPPLHAGVTWPEWIGRAEFGYTLMAPERLHPIRIVALGNSG